MYMITHGRIALSYLQEAIMSGFRSLMLAVERLARFVIGVGPDTFVVAVPTVITVLNSSRV